jgi:phytoene desaturase
MKIIIIGAGLGGLAAAIRLAGKDYKVTIFEKNATTGGKVNIRRAAGYSFDTGASLLTMRHVLEDLFSSVGKRLEDYLTLQKLDPVCRYRWTDGATFDASSDLTKTEAEIRRLAPEDLDAFRKFLTDSQRKYEIAERTFLAHSLNDLPKLLRPRYARDLAALSTFRTLAAHVDRHFRSPYLRQIFKRYATYNGSSPYRAPATFALIPFVEFGLGAWHVRGGMYELPRALEKLARELGVEIRANAEVEKIIIRDRCVRGVRLTSGEEFVCDALIANSDTIETYRSLIDERARPSFSDAKLNHLEPSSSGFVLLIGARRRFENLAHHNIFFSDDYPREFRQIFDELRPADNPTIYVCAASRTDASQAPANCENLFVLVNAPAMSERTSWAKEADAYRELVINKLESFGLENLRDSIEFIETVTPEDFQTRYRANRGAIYGISSNKLANAFSRPPNRSRDIRNLYFAGGAAHPGGGIPLVLLSGKMAAEMIGR